MTSLSGACNNFLYRQSPAPVLAGYRSLHVAASTSPIKSQLRVSSSDHEFPTICPPIGYSPDLAQAFISPDTTLSVQSRLSLPCDDWCLLVFAPGKKPTRPAINDVSPIFKRLDSSHLAYSPSLEILVPQICSTHNFLCQYHCLPDPRRELDNQVSPLYIGLETVVH
ncbi:unnamed protein product [Rhizoctonia solani]|uniref:Uncharacterized protein n=1 Tax=Rhizoctonia solani TaxID=456999 RepID=A0A8H3E359_9AGAM|nr:unnamed protein product [Rhizoctonia solani]